MTLQQEAREAFGFDRQIMALAEEANELSAACLRLLNGKGDRNAVMEEIIGVRSVASSIEADLGTPLMWASWTENQERKLARALARRAQVKEASGE